MTSQETDSKQHGSWSDCADAQAGLDPCWSQTHYVGFVMTQLKYIFIDTKPPLKTGYSTPSLFQWIKVWPN
jgi:hypothetical protein